jgi:hypothetical protein
MTQGTTAQVEIAGVDPYPAGTLNLAYSTGLDVMYLDQIIYVYLSGSQTLTLPPAQPGM